MSDINSICRAAGDKADRVTLPLSLCHNHIGRKALYGVLRAFAGIAGKLSLSPVKRLLSVHKGIKKIPGNGTV